MKHVEGALTGNTHNAHADGDRRLTAAVVAKQCDVCLGITAAELFTISCMCV